MIRVNGELIDPNLIEETFSRIKAEAEARLQASCCERDEEFMKQAEEEVIDSVLIAQEADKRYPTIPDDQIRERLKETLSLYRKHGASWEMLEEQRAQLHDECTANIRMETFLEDVLKTVPELTDSDLRAYYEEHLEDYLSQAEVRCLHLMKLLEPETAPTPAPELLDHMKYLREEILAGSDFAEVATRETDKQDKNIDLGWIPLDRPTNPFESVLFTMQKGEVSPVLSYEHAFHLVKITEIKPAAAPPFEEIISNIRERAELHRRRSALQNLAQSLRPQATIEQVDALEEEVHS